MGEEKTTKSKLLDSTAQPDLLAACKFTLVKIRAPSRLRVV